MIEEDRNIIVGMRKGDYIIEQNCKNCGETQINNFESFEKI